MQTTYRHGEAASFADEECPLAFALEVVGGKWRLPVVWELSKAPSLRYNELRRHLGKVTNATLSRVLSELESTGVVERHDHGEIPPRVDYSLTESGRRLVPILDLLYDWGARQELLLQGVGCESR
jgi:DNA-binding HxlR family transcriptional regulator